jgi:hypothetical protein
MMDKGDEVPSALQKITGDSIEQSIVLLESVQQSERKDSLLLRTRLPLAVT